MSSHSFQSTTTRRILTHPGFHARKQQILSSLTSSDPSSKIDKSPKGSVDEAILPLIELLNKHDDYVTTSSCSGRIAIYCAGKGIKKSFPSKSDSSNKNKPENHVNNNNYQINNDYIEEIAKDEDELELNEGDDMRHSMKGGGRWLFVTHSHVDLPKENNKEKLNEFLLKTIFGAERDNVILLKDEDSDYYNALQANDNRIVYFKFEPMILHVEARTLDSAKNLVSSAIDAGYRESGLLTTTKRHMVVIRSSLKLDAPIARLDSTNHKLYLFVNLSYLHLLVTLNNNKFDENLRKMKELYKRLEDHLFTGVGSEDGITRCTKETGKTWENKEERRERKRREGLARQIGLRKNGTLSDGNDGDVSTVDDESQGLDNA